jgi:hypothetical protein
MNKAKTMYYTLTPVLCCIFHISTKTDVTATTLIAKNNIGERFMIADINGLTSIAPNTRIAHSVIRASAIFKIVIAQNLAFIPTPLQTLYHINEWLSIVFCENFQ